MRKVSLTSPATRPTGLEPGWTDVLQDWCNFLAMKALLHVSGDSSEYGSKGEANVNAEAPVPVMRSSDLHRHRVPRIVAPIALHWMVRELTGWRGNALTAFIYYGFTLQWSVVALLRVLQGAARKHGFFDPDHPRDPVPDHLAFHVLFGLLLGALGRAALLACLAWDPSEVPWLNPVTLALHLPLYSVITDFWFYWYHRALHEIDFFWRFHRTHHLSKHPNSLLAPFADGVQELFDIFIVPVLAFYSTNALMPSVLSLGFYHWYACLVFVTGIELSGHSGVRVYAQGCTFFGLFNYLSCALCIEDHDMHHRFGYRDKTGNYGKQTRVWDRLFGTCMDRSECREDNIDWINKVDVPMWPK